MDHPSPVPREAATIVTATIDFSLEYNRHMLDAVTLAFLLAPDAEHKRQWLNSLWNREEAPLRIKLWTQQVA